MAPDKRPELDAAAPAPSAKTVASLPTLARPRPPCNSPFNLPARSVNLARPRPPCNSPSNLPACLIKILRAVAPLPRKFNKGYPRAKKPPIPTAKL